MGVVLKQSISGSIYIYLGTLLGGLNVSFLFPQILGETNWGIVSIVMATVMVSSQFTQLGSSNIVLKFFPSFLDNKEEKSAFFALTLLLNVLGMIGFVIVYSLLEEKIISPNIGDWIHEFKSKTLIVLFVLFNSLLTLSNAYLQINLRTSSAIFIKEFLIRCLQTIFIGFSYFYSLSILEILLLFSLSYFISFVWSFVLLIKNGFIYFHPKYMRLSQLPLRKLATYGVYTIIAGFGASLIANIDLLMISSLLTTGIEDAGKYRTTIYFATLIIIPLRPVNQTLFSVLSRKWKEEDSKKEIVKRYQQSVSIGLLLPGVLMLMLLLNLNIVENIFGNKLIDPLPVLFFFGLSHVFNAMSGVSGGIINLSDKYYYSLFFLIGLAILNVSLNLLLIPIFGVVGAAISTAASYFTISFVKFIFLRKSLDIASFNKRSVAQFTLVFAAIFIVSSIIWLVDFHFIYSLIIDVVLALLLFIYRNKIIQLVKQKSLL